MSRLSPPFVVFFAVSAATAAFAPGFDAAATGYTAAALAAAPGRVRRLAAKAGAGGSDVPPALVSRRMREALGNMTRFFSARGADAALAAAEAALARELAEKLAGIAGTSFARDGGAAAAAAGATATASGATSIGRVMHLTVGLREEKTTDAAAGLLEWGVGVDVQDPAGALLHTVSGGLCAQAARGISGGGSSSGNESSSATGASLWRRLDAGGVSASLSVDFVASPAELSGFVYRVHVALPQAGGSSAEASPPAAAAAAHVLLRHPQWCASAPAADLDVIGWGFTLRTGASTGLPAAVGGARAALTAARAALATASWAPEDGGVLPFEFEDVLRTGDAAAGGPTLPHLPPSPCDEGADATEAFATALRGALPVFVSGGTSWGGGVRDGDDGDGFFELPDLLFASGAVRVDEVSALRLDRAGGTARFAGLLTTLCVEKAAATVRVDGAVVAFSAVSPAPLGGGDGGEGAVAVSVEGRAAFDASTGFFHATHFNRAVRVDAAALAPRVAAAAAATLRAEAARLQAAWAAAEARAAEDEAWVRGRFAAGAPLHALGVDSDGGAASGGAAAALAEAATMGDLLANGSAAAFGAEAEAEGVGAGGSERGYANAYGCPMLRKGWRRCWVEGGGGGRRRCAEGFGADYADVECMRGVAVAALAVRRRGEAARARRGVVVRSRAASQGLRQLASGTLALPHPTISAAVFEYPHGGVVAEAEAEATLSMRTLAVGGGPGLSSEAATLVVSLRVDLSTPAAAAAAAAPAASLERQLAAAAATLAAAGQSGAGGAELALLHHETAPAPPRLRTAPSVTMACGPGLMAAVLAQRPTFRSIDARCGDGSKVLLVAAEQGSPVRRGCGAYYLRATWQGFDAPLCGGATQLLHQQVLVVPAQGAPRFASFPADTEVASGTSLDPGVTGVAEGLTACGDATVAEYSDETKGGGSGLDGFVVRRTWRLVRLSGEGPLGRCSTEAAASIRVSVSRVQRIAVAAAPMPPAAVLVSWTFGGAKEASSGAAAACTSEWLAQPPARQAVARLLAALEATGRGGVDAWTAFCGGGANERAAVQVAASVRVSGGSDAAAAAAEKAAGGGWGVLGEVVAVDAAAATADAPSALCSLDNAALAASVGGGNRTGASCSALACAAGYVKDGGKDGDGGGGGVLCVPAGRFDPRTGCLRDGDCSADASRPSCVRGACEEAPQAFAQVRARWCTARNGGAACRALGDDGAACRDGGGVAAAACACGAGFASVGGGSVCAAVDSAASSSPLFVPVVVSAHFEGAACADFGEAAGAEFAAMAQEVFGDGGGVSLAPRVVCSRGSGGGSNTATNVYAVVRASPAIASSVAKGVAGFCLEAALLRRRVNALGGAPPPLSSALAAAGFLRRAEASVEGTCVLRGAALAAADASGVCQAALCEAGWSLRGSGSGWVCVQHSGEQEGAGGGGGGRGDGGVDGGVGVAAAAVLASVLGVAGLLSCLWCVASQRQKRITEEVSAAAAKSSPV